MKKIKYFFEFLIIFIFLLIFKIAGYRIASNLGNSIGKIIGPRFRSKKVIIDNIKKFKPEIKEDEINHIIEKMWGNYGRILAEYVYISKFRKRSLDNYIKIEGLENLKKIKNSGKPTVFISGHFNNFELMAMVIEREGVELSAVYRPLNNKFLNILMEYLRKNYICKNQIKKGLKGVREALKYFKSGKSLAIMIDQRVSEGILSNFFNQNALTTTIPAQLVKKFNIPVVPVYIERINNLNFKIHINEPINFSKETSIEDITFKLNKILEKMILKRPDQWIWSHNRWK